MHQHLHTHAYTMYSPKPKLLYSKNMSYAHTHIIKTNARKHWPLPEYCHSLLWLAVHATCGSPVCVQNAPKNKLVTINKVLISLSLCRKVYTQLSLQNLHIYILLVLYSALSEGKVFRICSEDSEQCFLFICFNWNSTE